MICKYCRRFINFLDFLFNLGKCDYCNYTIRKLKDNYCYNGDSISQAVDYWKRRGIEI